MNTEIIPVGALSTNCYIISSKENALIIDPGSSREREIDKILNIIEDKKCGKSVVTHRIIDVYDEDGERMFVTKGDANNAQDMDPVSADKVVGLYRFRIPKLGDFAIFLQKPLGMMLFIAVPVLIFIIVDILRRRRGGRKNDDENERLRREIEELRAQNEKRTQSTATSNAADDAAKDADADKN